MFVKKTAAKKISRSTGEVITSHEGLLREGRARHFRQLFDKENVSPNTLPTPDTGMSFFYEFTGIDKVTHYSYD